MDEKGYGRAVLKRGVDWRRGRQRSEADPWPGFHILEPYYFRSKIAYTNK